MSLVAEIDLPTAVDYLVSGYVAVWTSVPERWDALPDRPRERTTRGTRCRWESDPSGLAVGSGAVWVGDEDTDTLWVDVA